MDMEQRDLLKDQIEQLGSVLGKLIARFFELKTLGDVSEAIQTTNKELLGELDLDIGKLVQMEAQELAQYFELNNMNDNHLDQLSCYLFEVGLHAKAHNENSLKWFKTVLLLLELADKNSNTITFDRLKLKKKIEHEFSKE